MFETIDDISINYTNEDDVLLIKELEKVVLTKGAWTTIVFRFQQWEPKNDKYGDDKYTIRRYKKSKGSYSQQSKFNISNKKQLNNLVEVFSKWL